MKIKRIRTQNYRGKNFDLEPAKINLFFAKNGTGKTIDLVAGERLP